MSRVLFLDIDGVLNEEGSYSEKCESCPIRLFNIEELNRIILATECKIVLSSAWRYMTFGDSMDSRGFEYLLRTHGAVKEINILGTTVSDDFCFKLRRRFKQKLVNGNLTCTGCKGIHTRGQQIQLYLQRMSELTSFCIVDNDDLGISRIFPKRFHHVKGGLGLQARDSNSIIDILQRDIKWNSRLKSQLSSLTSWAAI